MFKIVCPVQIKFAISFLLFSVDRGRICMCLWSDNTRTLINHGRLRLNKTLFLRTFHDRYRRRQVVDQCSLWKERPLQYTDLTHEIWRFLVYIFLSLSPEKGVQEFIVNVSSAVLSSSQQYSMFLRKSNSSYTFKRCQKSKCYLRKNVKLLFNNSIHF